MGCSCMSWVGLMMSMTSHMGIWEYVLQRVGVRVYMCERECMERVRVTGEIAYLFFSIDFVDNCIKCQWFHA